MPVTDWKCHFFLEKAIALLLSPPDFLPFPFRPFTYYVRTFIGFWLPPPSLPPYLHHFKHWKKAFFFLFFNPLPSYKCLRNIWMIPLHSMIQKLYWQKGRYLIILKSLIIIYIAFQKLYWQKGSYFIILRSLIILHSIFSEECKIL